jgi:hypothetical protein
MTPTYRILLAFLAARIAFGLVYIVTILRVSPLLRYYPLERRWAYQAVSTGISMDWYGRTGLALAWSIAAAAAILFAMRWNRVGTWLARPGMVRAVSHTGALVLALDFAYYAYVLWTRDLSAPPLPSWYCPR